MGTYQNYRGSQALPFRAPSQRDRILELLRERGSAGVTNVELNSIAFRYGGRIFELREFGYDIRTENLGDGRFRFILLHEPAQLKPLPSYSERAPREPVAPAVDSADWYVQQTGEPRPSADALDLPLFAGVR